MNNFISNRVKKYSRAKYFVFFTNLILFFSLETTKSYAQDNVLVIHSYHSEFPWTESIMEGIDYKLKQTEQDINVFHEFLDSKKHPSLKHSSSFWRYIRHKYQNTPIDILMVSDDPGLDQVLKVQREYFQDIPIVYLGINHVTPKLLSTSGITGVFENRDVAATITEAYRQTNSDTLIVINDTTETGKANLSKINQIQSEAKSFKKIIVLNDLIPQEIEIKLSQFPTSIPVFLIGQLRKERKNGALYNFEQTIKILKSKIDNPIYAVTVEVVNSGIVGGKILDGKSHAKKAAKLVLDILQGVSIEEIEPIVKAENRWIFDAKELAKHNVNLNSLPIDSEIINSKVSFYQKYQRLVWLTTVSFSITLLIIFLLIEIIRRSKISQKILQENEIRYKDLANAGANIFWEIDATGNFTYISGDTEKLFNKKVEDILGKSFREIFFHYPDLNLDWDIYETTIKTKQNLDNFIFNFKNQNQEFKIIQINGKPIYDHDYNFLGYRGIQREITQEYNLSAQIAYQAAYDSLTGLINRREFNQYLKNLVENSQQSDYPSVLCFLDLDRFKIVNDTAGHSVGDALLSELSNLLQSCIRKPDILARLGGDEFGLLLVNTSIEDAQTICQNIIDQVKNYKFSWNNCLFDIGISAGVLPITNNISDTTELLSKADIACYKAKDLGRSQMYLAEDQDSELKQHCLQMEYIANVSQAIERQQFHLVKQRIKSISHPHSELKHYEILLRYQDLDGNYIPPSLFIPAAEKYGVITMIDRWVIETVLNNYNQYFPEQKSIISINLSGISISNQDFVDYVSKLIINSPIDPNYICLEITETAAVLQISQATKFMTAMKNLGVKFALDDFGSGVSSFGYLKSLPVDYLKIDGSLIKNIVTEASDRAIVDAVNCVAQMMNIKTIAEFVEDDQILNVLAEIGVDYAQGYGIERPSPVVSQSVEIETIPC